VTVALFGRRQVDATVVALAWSRVVVVASQHWVARRSSEHPGAEVRNLQTHTENYWLPVVDGMPGPPADGALPGPTVSSTRTELRTRVYYTYDQVEWGEGRSLTADGSGPADVRWPDEPLAEGEAVRSRRESYTATFTSAGKQYEASLPEHEWRALEPGSACHLTLGLLGGVRQVSPGGS
jgi:hypothetical protein